MPRPITAWSYSRYADHARCAAAFRFKHILKIPEGPVGPALIRGSAIDDALAKYLTTPKSKVLPKDTPTAFRAAIAKLRKDGASSQLELAVDRAWKPVDWRDWDHAWLRAKLDAAVVYTADKRIEIVDFKTGRIRPEEHAQQLEIYAAVALAWYPDVEEITAAMWYYDADYLGSPAVFAAKAIGKLRKAWEKRVKPMFADKTFKPRPGPHCNWCAFSKKKGGPCLVA